MKLRALLVAGIVSLAASGAALAQNSLVTVQTGASNSVTGTQSGGHNSAQTYQYGGSNAVNMRQSGVTNTLGTFQQGGRNAVTASQTGFANRMDSAQIGGRNSVDARQLGVHNYGAVGQAGTVSNSVRFGQTSIGGSNALGVGQGGLGGFAPRNSIDASQRIIRFR
jgi:hypothetical protein